MLMSLIIALVAYEHIITVKYDMDFLFRKKWSASTWILVFNRYSLLATVLFIITPTTPQVSYLKIYLVSTLTSAEVNSCPIDILLRALIL